MNINKFLSQRKKKTEPNLGEKSIIMNPKAMKHLMQIESYQENAQGQQQRFLDLADGDILDSDRLITDQNELKAMKDKFISKTILKASKIIKGFDRSLAAARRNIELKSKKTKNELFELEKVWKKTKEDGRLLTQHLRDCENMPNYETKVKTLEEYIDSYFTSEDFVLPLDLLSIISEKPLLMKSIRQRQTSKFPTVILSSADSINTNLDTQKVRKEITKKKYHQTFDPVPSGLVTIREPSDKVNIVNGFFGRKRGYEKPSVIPTLRGRSYLGNELKLEELRENNFRDKNDYEKIFDLKYESYHKFDFESVSTNTRNFLKEFVRQFILEKYINLTLEKEEHNIYKIEHEYIPEGRMTSGITKLLRRQNDMLIKINEKKILNNFLNKKIRFMNCLPVKMNSKPKRNLNILQRPVTGTVDLPAQFTNRCFKFQNRTNNGAKKVMSLQGFTLLWYEKPNSEIANGFVNIARANMAISQVKAGVKALVLEPRNDGGVLMIQLDMDGVRLRDRLLKVTCVRDGQELIKRKLILKGYNSFFKFLGKVPLSDKFIAHLKPDAPLQDAIFLRSLTLNCRLTVLSLVNVRLSFKGFFRLFLLLDHLGKIRTLKKLELDKNEMEGSVQMKELAIKISEDIILTLDTLIFKNNQIGDDNLSILISGITRAHKLRQEMRKLKDVTKIPKKSPFVKFLDLSGTKMTDRVILSFRELFEVFNHREMMTIKIGNNDLTENGMLYLGEIISEFRVVKVLDISYSYLLTKDFLFDFLKIIRKNQNLQILKYKGMQVSKKNLERILNFTSRNYQICEIEFDMRVDLLQGFDFQRFEKRLRGFGFVIKYSEFEIVGSDSDEDDSSIESIST